MGRVRRKTGLGTLHQTGPSSLFLSDRWIRVGPPNIRGNERSGVFPRTGQGPTGPRRGATTGNKHHVSFLVPFQNGRSIKDPLDALPFPLPLLPFRRFLLVRVEGRREGEHGTGTAGVPPWEGSVRNTRLRAVATVAIGTIFHGDSTSLVYFFSLTGNVCPGL